MTKASLILKKSLLLTLTLCFLAGCSKSDQAKVSPADGSGGGGGGQGGGNEKLGLAPTFSESQFKNKQVIEWKGTAGNKVECVEWTWAGFFSSGIKLESRVYRNCDHTIPLHKVEYILFDPSTGDIVENYSINNDGIVEKGSHTENFFAYIYGNPKQVKEYFTVQTTTYLKNKYPTFQRSKQAGTTYLNEPGTPFHAVMTSWMENKSGVSWKYELNKSDPVIQPLPAE